MNAVINLTRADIEDIIGEKYSVPSSSVRVRAVSRYGPCGQEEHVAEAEVTLTRENMEEKGWV